MDKETFDALTDEEKIELYHETLGQDTDEAKWSVAFINSLPDSSFAAIGKDRYLPHHGKIDKHTSTNVDMVHLEKAAGRVNQIKEKGLISKAKGHLRGHYKALKKDIPPNLESEEPETFEDITYSKLHIVEDKELSEQTDGYLRGRLLGSIADKKNANKRLYPKAVWEKQISRIAELMTRGRFVGHTNHPQRGFFGSSGGVEDIVLKFEDVWFGDVEGAKQGSNELWLETIIIPTSKGKDIAEILKAGVELGVSSRGWGTQTPIYKEQPEGAEGEPELDYNRVNMDYEVDAFDIVYMPAEDEARVYKFEHREDDPMDVEEIRERYPELVNVIESAVKEPLDAELAEREEELVGLRASVETGMTIQKEQAEALEAKEGELASARSEIEGLMEQVELDKVGYQEAQTLIEAHEAELVELRPLKPKLEALNHLLEKVQGLPMAWRLVDVLRECETPAEIDEKFDEAKDNAEALLYAEDFLGTRGGKAKYGLAPGDAESDEEYEEKQEQMKQAAKRSGLI